MLSVLILNTDTTISLYVSIVEMKMCLDNFKGISIFKSCIDCGHSWSNQTNVQLSELGPFIGSDV